MANDSTLRRRLNRMAKDRVEAQRAQTRRTVALDVLDETGEVTSAAVDARMSEVWTEPSEQALANALAAKTKAAVDYEEGELERARDAVERSDRRVEKARDRLADAERAAEEARRAVTEIEARVEEARALRDLAAEQGDPAAAAPTEDVRVEADTANANTED